MKEEESGKNVDFYTCSRKLSFRVKCSAMFIGWSVGKYSNYTRYFEFGFALTRCRSWSEAEESDIKFFTSETCMRHKRCFGQIGSHHIDSVRTLLTVDMTDASRGFGSITILFTFPLLTIEGALLTYPRDLDS